MKKQTEDIALAVDWNKIRNDFPILARTVNNKKLVYLDSGASSEMPEAVSSRVNSYYRNEHANVHRGVHTLSQQATDAYELTRHKVQQFINAEFWEEIIFTTGTTDSINLVAQSYGRTALKPGSEILLTEMEHHANIVPWQMIAEQTGAVIKVVPINEAGELIMEDFYRLLTDKTSIVAVTHVSNALGTVNPVKEIIRAAHERGIPVLVDGAQGVPHMSVDVRELDADFYTFSAHKMCGPTGFGILYGKKHLLEKMPPYRGGGDMIDLVTFEKTTYNTLPFKFEAGTPPIAAGIGFGTSIDYLEAIGMDNIAARGHQLLQYATEQLSRIEGVKIYGTAARKAGVISFLINNIHPTDAGTILDKEGIAVRTGHHCAQPVMQHYNIPGTVRASFSFYNNEDDIDALVNGIEMVKEFFV